jgi:hypothetical protein
MDYLADYVHAGAGCEDKQQQVIITFRPRAVVEYLHELTAALTITMQCNF